MTTTAIDSSIYSTVSEAIRNEAKRILTEGLVTAVVGYAAGRRKDSVMPIIITDPADAEKLIFTQACVNNLAVYLTKSKKEVPKKGKIGIVAKGCDFRALIGLITESQFKREDIYVMGIPCAGVLATTMEPSRALNSDTIASKCLECDVHFPKGADFIPDVKAPADSGVAARYAAEIARLEALTPAERWAFWKEQFAKCIKCYACRQVCPFCYCEQCICDRNKPQMLESTPRPAGNFSWHLVRAAHLAGRCSGCGECERVCPMDIPINLLNRKMANELKELYDFEVGLDVQESGPLNTFTESDDQSFIK